MAHLTINGIGVECSSSEFFFATGGEVVRSFNGRPRSSGRYRARDYRFSTDAGGLLHEDAERLRALLLGDGHSWGFETDTYSSRKLIPSAAVDYEIAPDEGYWETGLKLYAGTGAITWNLSGDTGWTWNTWTLMHWRKVSTNPWHHWIRTSAGGSWMDGAPAAALPDVTFSGGVLTLDEDIDDRWYDDLVALPYVVPTAWVPLLETFAAERTWPDLPYVYAAGPGVPSGGLTAMAEIGQNRRVPLRDGGSFVSGDLFDFTLRGL